MGQKPHMEDEDEPARAHTSTDPTTEARSAIPARPAGGTVQAVLSTATGEQCPSCGKHMAPDQRYCLACGERRGASRLPLMDGLAATQRPAPAASNERRPRWSPNAAMIAGVGTLLLAMGVGVLIGRSSNHSSNSSGSGLQVLKVPASGNASTSPTAGSGKTASATSSNAAKKPPKHVQSVAAAVGGQSSVEGKPKQKLPPPTVQLGDKGHGAGYTNGKFTGQFFGPGSGH